MRGIPSVKVWIIRKGDLRFAVFAVNRRFAIWNAREVLRMWGIGFDSVRVMRAGEALPAVPAVLAESKSALLVRRVQA